MMGRQDRDQRQLLDHSIVLLLTSIFVEFRLIPVRASLPDFESSTISFSPRDNFLQSPFGAGQRPLQQVARTRKTALSFKFNLEDSLHLHGGLG
jgi:hypothetical protein